MPEINNYIYATAGYNSEDRIAYINSISRCGSIDDGVTLNHLRNYRSGGDWVLSFEDFQEIYFRAANFRGLTIEHVGKAYLDFLEYENA